MITLLINRDKNCFGTCIAVTESYPKNSYRIKDGEVQIKHAGKWRNVKECRSDSTDFLRGIYINRGLGNAPGKVCWTD